MPELEPVLAAAFEIQKANDFIRGGDAKLEHLVWSMDWVAELHRLLGTGEFQKAGS